MSQRPTATVELKQLARLYRIAARIPDLDLAGLQRLPIGCTRSPWPNLRGWNLRT
jgi:hypothetical protein